MSKVHHKRARSICIPSRPSMLPLRASRHSKSNISLLPSSSLLFSSPLFLSAPLQQRWACTSAVITKLRYRYIWALTLRPIKHSPRQTWSLRYGIRFWVWRHRKEGKLKMVDSSNVLGQAPDFCEITSLCLRFPLIYHQWQSHPLYLY